MSTNNIEQERIVFCSKAPSLFVVAAGVLIFSLFGCGGEKAPTFLSGKKTPKTGQITKEELRKELNNFEEYAASVTKQATDEIDTLLPGIRTQKTNLIQKARLRQGFNTMIEQKEPVIAFIETWGLCVRYRMYLAEGEGSKIFGEYQDIALNSAIRIEERIEEIGRQFLKEDTFLETRRQVHNFARQNPMTGTFSNVIMFATETKPGEPNAFDNALSIPMAPFTALKGVDKTATAIREASGSLDNMTDVVQNLPESARWQLLLLLLEIEDIEAVKTVLKSMTKLSDSSVRFADSAEKLPEQLRQQFSILVEDIDEKQANLQTTIEKAEKTSASFEQAMVQAEKVAVSFQSTVNDVNQTAIAWEKAASATGEALAEINKMRTPRKDAAPKAPFKISDYRDTAETVTATVSELRNLIAEVRELTESDDLAKSSSAARQWVNYLTLRIALLVLIIFVLALLYRIVATRIVDKKKQTSIA
jgi:hypothetical protein